MRRRQLIGSRRRLVSTKLTTAPGPPPRLPAASCAAEGPSEREKYFSFIIINWITPNLPLKAIEREREREKENFRKVWRQSSHRSERASCESLSPAAAASAPIRSVASSSRFACLLGLIGWS
jgi:hypothetical protein